MEQQQQQSQTTSPHDWISKFFRCLIARRLKRHLLHSDRVIKVGEKYVDYPNNRITTRRYNAINFIPKNLLLQFSKPANMYFLILGLLQLIPQISNSNGKPTILMPLAIIVIISSIKEIVEDLRKRKFDNAENSKLTLVFKQGAFKAAKWEDLYVGDIVRVNESQYFPADMLIIYTPAPKGVCFIETKNLDGETNLKSKHSHKDVLSDFDTIEKITKANNLFSYEKPNDYLYKFVGSIETSKGTAPLGEQNFVLRGCSLRNTEYVIGVVAYTGHQNKIMLNAIKSKVKFSKLEEFMNRIFIWVFVGLFLLALIVSIFAVIRYEVQESSLEYLQIDDPDTYNKFHDFTHFITLFGIWLLLLSRIVPIALIVTLELCRLFQSVLITKDPLMNLSTNPELCVSVQSPSLTEELGQVQYVLSDKTGTLTKNIMNFKNISIKGKVYGDQDVPDFIKNGPKLNNVDFWDQRLIQDLENKHSLNYHHAFGCLVLLATCHTIIAETKNGEIVYNAASPDELALVNFSKFLGMEYLTTNEGNIIHVRFRGFDLKFRLLYVLEFNSNRKRMSVIIKNDEGQVILYTKGADTVLFERLAIHGKSVETSHNTLELIQETQAHLLAFASQGLRTLVLCQKQVDHETFLEWEKDYKNACVQVQGREELVESLQDEIERDLELVGATAIEDKLQDEVDVTIKKLQEAGIKVWILTGDKVETAINIGFACGLLNDSMQHLKIIEKSSDEVAASIHEKLALVQKSGPKVQFSLIVSGEALLYAMKPELAIKLMELADRCHALIACRVSPKQKHLIVSLVKQRATVLAIGDGANDVHMLSSASVSVGIRGLEGQQAAKASDFAIGEFRILQRLLFYHGRENYRRNSYTILYSFYKNALSIIGLFWYGFVSMFSGTSFYEDFSYQAFNVLFSSIPIIAFAVFDAEYPAQELIKTPLLYIQGIRNQLFNPEKFAQWFSLAVFEAAILTFTSYYAFDYLGFYPANGMKTDYYGAGMMIYFCTVVAINLRVLTFSHTWTGLLLLSILLMIVLFILTIWGLSFVNSLPITGLFSKLFGNPLFWIISIMQIAFLHIINVAYTRHERLVEEINLKQIKQQQQQQEALKDEIMVLEFEKPKEVLETKCLTAKTLSKVTDQSKDGSVFDTNELEMSIEKDIAAYSSKRKYTGFAFSGPEMDPGLRNARG